MVVVHKILMNGQLAISAKKRSCFHWRAFWFPSAQGSDFVIEVEVTVVTRFL